MRESSTSGRPQEIEERRWANRMQPIFDYAYGVEPGGNVPAHQDIRGELKGKNVLYEAHSTEETAKKFGLTVQQTAEKLTAGRKSLVRSAFSPPAASGRRQDCHRLEWYDDLRSGAGQPGSR